VSAPGAGSGGRPGNGSGTASRLDVPISSSERDELIRLRRDFHRHPELGFRETRTAGIVAERMRALGYDVREGVATTGVLATRGTGRTLLLRADMDALPIHEENDADYRSLNDGVMHACGHDGHTAIAMMAATRLAAAELPGRVRFAFQPAEENGRGADGMIAEGAVEGVEAAIGLHLWSRMPVGKVAVTAGPFMAAVDEFTVTVPGRGGHAAKPHEADDPVVRAAAVVTDLQTVISRRVDPMASAVLSVTSIHGGSAFNVIPERVVLQGTVRTFEESVRDGIHAAVRDVVGARGRVEIQKVTRPLVNDAGIAATVREAAASVVGAANVVDDVRMMAGEDFASFAAAVPACFFHVGAGGPDCPPHHHPRFDVDEAALPIGLEILCRAARLWLRQGAQ
jgi:amidohydrolase